MTSRKYSSSVAGLLAVRTFAAERMNLQAGRLYAAVDATIESLRLTGNSTVCSTYVIDTLAAGCRDCGVGAIGPELFASSVLPQDVFDAVEAETVGVYVSGRTRNLATRYRGLVRIAQTVQTKGDQHVN